jgi:hypothetical protein
MNRGLDCGPRTQLLDTSHPHIFPYSRIELGEALEHGCQMLMVIRWVVSSNIEAVDGKIAQVVVHDPQEDLRKG